MWNSPKKYRKKQRHKASEASLMGREPLTSIPFMMNTPSTENSQLTKMLLNTSLKAQRTSAWIATKRFMKMAFALSDPVREKLPKYTRINPTEIGRASCRERG